MNPFTHAVKYKLGPTVITELFRTQWAAQQRAAALLIPGGASVAIVRLAPRREVRNGP